MIEYRVDDLARRAGVSVRNVRVYQDRGLLPPPRREGRTGWYNEAHLARLELISRMLERGYTFATISELLNAAQSGLRVEDVLTSDSAAEHQPEAKHLSREDFQELFGPDISDADLRRGADMGVIVETGNGYRIDNPVLLDAARLLHDAGIPLSTTIDQTEAVRSDLDDVARRFVALVTDKFLDAGKDPFDTDAGTVGEVAELVNSLRPLTYRVVGALFREAMDQRITLTMEEVLAQYGDKPESANDQAS
ncbi:MerR family transcriptional regulator [Rhodococcus sp. EPR-157]|uniref:MerR family transcriptional regulator n=1 Tax=Rhodococcus sp. EPR-157 TaxID=1813677 RepID=UPI0007BC2B4E|nr:MerR family transcriptional regulator [Rhodococcus sp. EPR-157]KZF00245.1 MerR family transcriptional regulator [Rhodococcus sp. EPR-157]